MRVRRAGYLHHAGPHARQEYPHFPRNFLDTIVSAKNLYISHIAFTMSLSPSLSTRLSGFSKQRALIQAL